MNKSELMAYLEGIDGGLKQPAMLYIYGSAVCILLDEPDRTSLDIDVPAPIPMPHMPILRRRPSEREYRSIPANKLHQTILNGSRH